MGKFSVILINHDDLDKIENDPHFGENLSLAITKARHSHEYTIPVISGSHTPAKVIGNCFHGNDVKFFVIESGTGWIADGRKKPQWSQVTWDLVKKVFGGTKPGY